MKQYSSLHAESPERTPASGPLFLYVSYANLHPVMRELRSSPCTSSRTAIIIVSTTFSSLSIIRDINGLPLISISAFSLKPRRLPHRRRVLGPNKTCLYMTRLFHAEMSPIANYDMVPGHRSDYFSSLCKFLCYLYILRLGVGSPEGWL